MITLEGSVEERIDQLLAPNVSFTTSGEGVKTRPTSIHFYGGEVAVRDQITVQGAAGPLTARRLSCMSLGCVGLNLTNIGSVFGVGFETARTTRYKAARHLQMERGASIISCMKLFFGAGIFEVVQRIPKPPEFSEDESSFIARLVADGDLPTDMQLPENVGPVALLSGLYEKAGLATPTGQTRHYKTLCTQLAFFAHAADILPVQVQPGEQIP